MDTKLQKKTIAISFLPEVKTTSSWGEKGVLGARFTWTLAKETFKPEQIYVGS